MKKRGSKSCYKKGKQKEKLLLADSTLDPVSRNMEHDMDLDENEHFDSNIGSTSPTILRDRTIDAALSTKGPTPKLGPGRVKVKLKSSRLLEDQRTHSDLQSDTDVSQFPGHKLNIENKEDSAYSDGLTSDLQTTSTKSPRKSGSIKIISSKVMDKYLNKPSSSVQMLGERGFIPSDNEKTVDSPASPKVHQSKMESPYQDSCYNEKELKDALLVIKKVMKMDAAEPFNAPVDPVALEIPDYFDVIDTPMDFGTICNNLEHGRNYLNSEDVLKDVQIIWDNCSKYNNKGDYIIDLMKRVKKNFMKYWLAAGLYYEVPPHGVMETTNGEERSQSHHEKLYAKGKISKYKRKRLGTNHHKSGCLCAVCVVRRQKKEREGNATSAASTFMEPNGEEGFPTDNHDSEHSSVSLSQSPMHHSIANAEELEHGETDDPEFQNKIMEDRQLRRAGFEENEMEHHSITGPSVSQSTLVKREVEDGLDFKVGLEDYKVDVHFKAQACAEKEHVEKQQKQTEVPNQIDLYEDPLREENHSIIQICGAIFSRDCNSVWNGSHSLTHRGGVSSARTSPLHAAVSMFFKK